MAWGYEKCFVIEHDNTLKRKIDCKDCCYYERDDKSCMKRPLYLPVDGYNSWKNCDFFELDFSTSHYEEKKAQYANVLKRKANAQKSSSTTVPKTKAKVAANVKTQPTSNATQKSQIKPVFSGKEKYRVCEVTAMPKGQKLRYEYVEIVTSTNKKRLIQVAFNEVEHVAYIVSRQFTAEALELVKKRLQ